MLAQIVFFLALAAFLILLVRRTQGSMRIFNIIGSTIVNFGRSIGRLGVSAILGLKARTRNVKSKIPLISSRDGERVVHADSHTFWNEEPADNSSEIAGFFDEGDELFKKGKYAEAEEFFLKAATRTPGDARVYARLGVIYLHQKNFNDAIESLKVAVKCDKYNPSRHYNQALAYMGNNDRQKATVSAREAITLDPVTKKYRQLLDHLLERK